MAKSILSMLASTLAKLGVCHDAESHVHEAHRAMQWCANSPSHRASDRSYRGEVQRWRRSTDYVQRTRQPRAQCPSAAEADLKDPAASRVLGEVGQEWRSGSGTGPREGVTRSNAGSHVHCRREPPLGLKQWAWRRMSCAGLSKRACPRGPRHGTAEPSSCSAQ